VNVIARNKVKSSPSFAGSFLPEIISWCAQVTVAPDKSNIKVLSKGTPQGLNAWIALGGQTEPISTAGDKLEWKKAQKKARKNITSETINKIIPERKPCWTVLVWCPLKVASLITSLHHTAIPQITINSPENKTTSPLRNECINVAAPSAVTKIEIDKTKGHGLGSTKW